MVLGCGICDAIFSDHRSLEDHEQLHRQLDSLAANYNTGNRQIRNLNNGSSTESRLRAEQYEPTSGKSEIETATPVNIIKLVESYQNGTYDDDELSLANGALCADDFFDIADVVPSVTMAINDVGHQCDEDFRTGDFEVSTNGQNCVVPANGNPDLGEQKLATNAVNLFNENDRDNEEATKVLHFGVEIEYENISDDEECPPAGETSATDGTEAEVVLEAEKTDTPDHASSTTQEVYQIESISQPAPMAAEYSTILGNDGTESPRQPVETEAPDENSLLAPTESCTQSLPSPIIFTETVDLDSMEVVQPNSPIGRSPTKKRVVKPVKRSKRRKSVRHSLADEHCYDDVFCINSSIITSPIVSLPVEDALMVKRVLKMDADLLARVLSINQGLFSRIMDMDTSLLRKLTSIDEAVLSTIANMNNNLLAKIAGIGESEMDKILCLSEKCSKLNACLNPTVVLNRVELVSPQNLTSDVTDNANSTSVSATLVLPQNLTSDVTDNANSTSVSATLVSPQNLTSDVTDNANSTSVSATLVSPQNLTSDVTDNWDSTSVSATLDVCPAQVNSKRPKRLRQIADKTKPYLKCREKMPKVTKSDDRKTKVKLKRPRMKTHKASMPTESHLITDVPDDGKTKNETEIEAIAPSIHSANTKTDVADASKTMKEIDMYRDPVTNETETETSLKKVVLKKGNMDNRSECKMRIKLPLCAPTARRLLPKALAEDDVAVKPVETSGRRVSTRRPCPKLPPDEIITPIRNRRFRSVIKKHSVQDPQPTVGWKAANFAYSPAQLQCYVKLVPIDTNVMIVAKTAEVESTSEHSVKAAIRNGASRVAAKAANVDDEVGDAREVEHKEKRKRGRPKKKYKLKEKRVKIVDEAENTVELKCRNCGQHFDSLTSLMAHRDADCLGSLIKYGCVLCPCRFDDRASLVQHSHLHHICIVCGCVVKHLRDMKQHLEMHDVPCLCRLCDRPFSDLHELMSHAEDHPCYSKLECCAQTYDSREDLANHCFSEHKDDFKAVECVHCGDWFPMQCFLDLHLPLHSADESLEQINDQLSTLHIANNVSDSPSTCKQRVNETCAYKCHICRHGFSRLAKWTVHSRSAHVREKHLTVRFNDIQTSVADREMQHSAQNDYNMLASVHYKEENHSYPICEETMNDTNDDLKHVFSHEQTNIRKSLKCKLSNHTSDKTVKSHKTANKRKNKAENDTAVGIICEYCGYYARSECNRRLHNLRHHAEKRHRCSDCGQVFGANFILLKKHSALPTYGNETRKMCEKCGRLFVREQRLKTHQAKVYPTRRRKCIRCEKELTMSSIFRHQFMHGKYARPNYRCNSCSFQTANSRVLKVHERIHTVKKPKKCPACKRLFASVKHLNYHIALHQVNNSPV